MTEPILHIEKQAVETLGLRPQDKRLLIDDLNCKSQQPVEVERRRPRYPFNNGEINVQVRHPNGAQTSYRMLTRNLNSHGIGLVLGRFVYVNTVCAIELPTLDNERITMTGKVVHCRHLSGVVHELGVAFDRPIEVENFISELQHARDTAAAMPHLTGRVLIVDEFASERRILSHMMAELGLVTMDASNEEEMLEKLQAERADLIVIDTDSTEDDGMALVAAARKAGFKESILALSVNDNESARADAEMCGFAGLINKPIDLTRLTLLISKSIPQVHAPITSTLAHDPAMRPLIKLYVDEAVAQASSLSAALGLAEQPKIMRLVKHLKGTGSSYGFDIISRLASAALKEFSSGDQHLKAYHATLNDLIGALSRLSVATDERRR